MSPERTRGDAPRKDDAVRGPGRAGRMYRVACGFVALAVWAILGSPASGPSESAELRTPSQASAAVAQADFRDDPSGRIQVRSAASLGQAPLEHAVLDHPRLSQAGSVLLTGGAVTQAAAPREEDPRLEGWREEGLRMAAELTGIPEAFFRWLQDKGVPVGEFMRFLMPFLEWLDMVEPHNGTQTSPKPQRPSGDKPRQTTI